MAQLLSERSGSKTHAWDCHLSIGFAPRLKPGIMRGDPRTVAEGVERSMAIESTVFAVGVVQ